MGWFGRRRVRTARCILTFEDQHMLVVHRGPGREHAPVWGLPGGHLDWGESPESAARRELQEELYLELGDLTEVGDYHYKDAWHRVYAAAVQAPVWEFDNSELLQVGWHSLDEVAQFQRGRQLHAGYELEALLAVRERLRSAG